MASVLIAKLAIHDEAPRRAPRTCIASLPASGDAARQRTDQPPLRRARPSRTRTPSRLRRCSLPTIH